MIYHYDTATGTDILGRSVRTAAYRYNEWSNSGRDRELYLTSQPPRTTTTLPTASTPLRSSVKDNNFSAISSNPSPAQPNAPGL